MKHLFRQNSQRYTSEFTDFMNGFLASHPEVEEDRRRGWRIWWERKVDLKELEQARADTVPRQPYHYD
jgi:hypothetical protein